jgi:hypothetical protein
MRPSLDPLCQNYKTSAFTCGQTLSDLAHRTSPAANEVAQFWMHPPTTLHFDTT